MSTAATTRWMRIDGDRRAAVGLDAPAIPRDAGEPGAEPALAYGFAQATAEKPIGMVSLGEVPRLVRPLRLGYALDASRLPAVVRGLVPSTPLVAPFGGSRRTGVRELTSHDPRMTRLWERFSVDVPVALERSAKHVASQVFDAPDREYRVLVLEDGDRYAIRAMCIFTAAPEGDDDGARLGRVVELLHDRSVVGMRAASHLLGLAVRELSLAGADAIEALSLSHSGSYPVFARHAFFAPRGGTREPLEMRVRPLDPLLEPLVTRREHWYLSYLDALRG